MNDKNGATYHIHFFRGYHSETVFKDGLHKVKIKSKGKSNERHLTINYVAKNVLV